MTLVPIDLTKQPERPVPLTFYTDTAVAERVAQMQEESGLSRSEVIHRTVSAALFGAVGGTESGVAAQERAEGPGNPADRDGNLGERRRSDDRRERRAS